LLLRERWREGDAWVWAYWVVADCGVGECLTYFVIEESRADEKRLVAGNNSADHSERREGAEQHIPPQPQLPSTSRKQD